MRHVSLAEVLEIHHRVIRQSGGSAGVRDIRALESAVAQPRMTFGGDDLYPTIVEKASALAFSLVANHPFLDGNKRSAHAVMETFLILNGFEVEATVDEQERTMLDLATGTLGRDAFTTWLRSHAVKIDP